MPVGINKTSHALVRYLYTVTKASLLQSTIRNLGTLQRSLTPPPRQPNPQVLHQLPFLTVAAVLLLVRNPLKLPVPLALQVPEPCEVETKRCKCERQSNSPVQAKLRKETDGNRARVGLLCLVPVKHGHREYGRDKATGEEKHGDNGECLHRG